jgi:DNA replication protein DnaC
MEILSKYGFIPKKKENYILNITKNTIISFVKNYFEFEFEWKQEYDNIVSYLNGTDGKSLLLTGTGGTGKTLFAKYIIPSLFLKNTNRVFKFYELSKITKESYNKIISTNYNILDDLGTESIINDYGNIIDVIPNIIDDVEQNNKLFILTTNLNDVDIKHRYGNRTLERLLINFKIVKIVNDKSMRLVNLEKINSKY